MEFMKKKFYGRKYLERKSSSRCNFLLENCPLGEHVRSKFLLASEAMFASSETAASCFQCHLWSFFSYFSQKVESLNFHVIWIQTFDRNKFEINSSIRWTFIKRSLLARMWILMFSIWFVFRMVLYLCIKLPFLIIITQLNFLRIRISLHNSAMELPPCNSQITRTRQRDD